MALDLGKPRGHYYTLVLLGDSFPKSFGRLHPRDAYFNTSGLMQSEALHGQVDLLTNWIRTGRCSLAHVSARRHKSPISSIRRHGLQTPSGTLL